MDLIILPLHFWPWLIDFGLGRTIIKHDILLERHRF